MAITQKDIDISNVSYTNKDFEAVYTELMDLATKISTKYVPSESNEGDPFIVVLKLLAFVADKVNYNIDKNILERFLMSATQTKSVKELCAMLGYNMTYYQAPTTKVICKFNFTGDETYSDGSDSSRDTGIVIPKFTKFTDSTGSLVFTSTEEGLISKTTKSSEPIPVIQGEQKTLSVLDSETITLENLDENNCIYFPETMVAENGVFIEGGSSDSDTVDDEGWVRVDNLNSVDYDSYSYEFGYDSKSKLPFIKFPEWISEIIGSGLTIKYIVTSGINGNVASKSITSITLSSDYLPTNTYGDDGTTVTSANISVTNTSAADNGKDPETITEALTSFKKTIGTFDTLVSCRDYANFIYKAVDDYSNNYVSNVQVADRRTDINYGCNIVTFNSTGSQNESMTNSEDISASDLCLYPLTPSNDFELSTDSGKYDGYNKTFTALYDTSGLEDHLEESKCLSHDYKRYEAGDIYSIKNYYKLSATIYTTKKVNEIEQYEILLNVNNKLAETYNARNVDFGYEISSFGLQQVITNADSRIKSVSLYDPDIETKGYIVDSVADGRYYDLVETPLKDSDGNDSTWFKTVVAKNILSGKISMLNYDEAFDFDFGESSGIVIDNIEKFTSNTNIGSVNGEYCLQSNEVIEMISPNYVNSDSTYPYGVNYHLELSGDTSQTVTITSITVSPMAISVTYSTGDTKSFERTDILQISKQKVDASSTTLTEDIEKFKNTANQYKYYIKTSSTGDSTVVNYPSPFTSNCISKDSVYQLGSNDKLIVQWTNSSETVSSKTFSSGDLIKPNFNMYTTKYTINVLGKTALNKTLEDGTTCQMFTLGTSEEIQPVKEDSQEITSKKYVYWSVSNSNNEITWDDNNEYILEADEYFFFTDLNFSELYTFGPGTLLKKTGLSSQTWTVERISDITNITDGNLEDFQDMFIILDCNSDNKVKFTIQNIITLSEGDYIKTSSAQTITDNKFSDINTLSYKIDDGDYQTLPTLPTGVKWRARAVLDLASGPDSPQTLVGNQKVTLYATSRDYEITSGYTFKFNVLKQVVGGEDKEISYIDLSLTKKLVSAYVYKSTEKEGLSLGKASNSTYYAIKIPSSLAVTIKTPSITNRYTYIMLYVEFPSTSSAEKVTVTYKGAGLECYNNSDYPSTGIIDKSGVYVLKLTYVSELTLTFSVNTITCIVSRPRLVKLSEEINPLLGLSSSTDIKKFISEKFPSQWKKFNVVNFTDSVKHINVSSTYDLSSPMMFYDYNNIANKWTIPVVDIDNSDIIISINSRKA